MTTATRRRTGAWPRRLATLMAASLMVAACGGDDGDGDQDRNDEEPVAASDEDADEAGGAEDPSGDGITFMGFYAEADIRPFLDAWEAHRPDIPVTYQEVPFTDLNDVIEARLGAGDPVPDVITADQPRIANLVERGFLLDITDEVGDVDEIFLPAAIEASSVDGRLYALPLNTSTQFLYANLDLLEAGGAGAPPAHPDRRWTWDDAIAAARAAQDAGAEWGLQFQQISRIYQMQPLPESLGGGSGLTGPDMLTPDFTNEGWVKAMEFYSMIHEEGISARGLPPGESTELFRDGRVALFIAGPWNLRGFADDESGLEFNWSVGAHPYFGDGVPVTPTGSWSWGVNQNSENQADAIEFIRYATENLEGMQAMLEVDSNIPANVEALDAYVTDDVLQLEFDGTTVGELMAHELANTAVIRAPSPAFIIYEEFVGAALEDIRNGEPVEATLQQLEADLAAALERRG